MKSVWVGALLFSRFAMHSVSISGTAVLSLFKISATEVK